MADSRALELSSPSTPERAVAPAERSALRLAYLDSLRALAALYVVAFHCVLGFAAKDLSGPWRILRRACAFGHEAVAIFIVLSGYCLMLPVIRRAPERPAAPFAPFMR
ncbi:MAG TPA: acyltransferase family protein, partial [Polyangiaceae bacterium]|nr:acyltransferase family protein [Polyangiaceae bacterium]